MTKRVIWNNLKKTQGNDDKFEGKENYLNRR